MRAPLVPITIALLLGILAGRDGGPVVVVAAATISAIAALVTRRDGRMGITALLVLWLCLGMLRVQLRHAHPENRLSLVLPDAPQPVCVHGVVITDPAGPLDPDEETRAVGVIRLLHWRGAGGWQPLAGRLRAHVQQPRVALTYGDELLLEGEWSHVPSPGNPGQYDWRAALVRRRIHGLLRVRPYDGLVVLRQGQGNPVLAAVFRLRARWVRLIQEHFKPRDAGLLLALLLGERTEIDEELKEAFTTTGTIHSLATQCTKLP